MPPKPLQNRVAPTGEIVAHPARGLLMGNRGCLHGPDGRLGTSRWRSKLWICCVLDWQGRQRAPMPPGRWTALFFLDEVTALAAGHRPCGYCRRAAYRSFAEAWRVANRLPEPPRAAEMDSRLHAERVDRHSRRQLTRPVLAGTLPDGAVVTTAGTPGMVAGGHVYPWSFTGYGAPHAIAPETTVELLTPPVTVAVLAAGYRPLVHPSASLNLADPARVL